MYFEYIILFDLERKNEFHESHANYRMKLWFFSQILEIYFQGEGRSFKVIQKGRYLAIEQSLSTLIQ